MYDSVRWGNRPYDMSKFSRRKRIRMLMYLHKNECLCDDRTFQCSVEDEYLDSLLYATNVTIEGKKMRKLFIIRRLRII